MVTNRAYDISSRSVAERIGIELREIEDWNCCGATSYLALNEKMSFVLSARNLALAEKMSENGKGELATICNGCYVALRKTNQYMIDDAEIRRDIRQALQAGDMDYQGTIQVRHLLDIFVHDIGEERIRSLVGKPLTGLKVAAYSGCQLGRPFVDVEDPEFPTMMDTLLTWLGAETVYFPYAAKCCGGMIMTTQRPVGLRLTGTVLLNAKTNGADCVATACPLCQINLEGYQSEASSALKSDCTIPVFYFTQLMGIAFGISEKELALKDNLTPYEVALTGRSR
jgi:heterodisulfide reductase subunit B